MGEAVVDFDVLKAGVLSKQGHLRQNWSQRFVVLFASRIQWYQLRADRDRDRDREGGGGGGVDLRLEKLRGERPIRPSDVCSVMLVEDGNNSENSSSGGAGGGGGGSAGATAAMRGVSGFFMSPFLASTYTTSTPSPTPGGDAKSSNRNTTTNSSSGSKQARRWRFDLCIGSYTLKLDAASEQERKEWVRELRRHLVDRRADDDEDGDADGAAAPDIGPGSGPVVLSPFQIMQSSARFAKYFRMLDMGVRLHAVLHRMQTDGIDADDMATFKAGMQPADDDDADGGGDGGGGGGAAERRRGSRVLPPPLVPLRKVHWNVLTRAEAPGSVWGGFGVNVDLGADANRSSQAPVDAALDFRAHWQQSVWSDLAPRFSATHQMQMRALFRMRAPDDGSGGAARQTKSKSRFGNLLDGKRVNNVGIGMRKVCSL